MSPRLDAELVRRGLARSRAQAADLVRAGRVLVDGSTALKPSTTTSPNTPIEVAGDDPAWVGRAAYKLIAALDSFGPRGLVVTGKRCLDVGASTGGFTQVLLRRGAAHVTALDVGHGQLVPELAADPRVTERSGTSIRDIGPEDLGGRFDLVVVDLSFISLRLVLPALTALTDQDGYLVALIKPQFEVGRDRLGKGGVVRNEGHRRDALLAVLWAAADVGLRLHGLMTSPIRGAAGNREYLGWWTPGGSKRSGHPHNDLETYSDLERLVAAVETPS
mgnify:CR=1 FL=1